MPVIGDNSGFAAAQLIVFVERLERLDEEKRALSEDRKEVLGEAKGQGFDTKIIQQVIRLRKMDPADRIERDSLITLYMDAIKEAEKAQVAKSVAEGV